MRSVFARIAATFVNIHFRGERVGHRGDSLCEVDPADLGRKHSCEERRAGNRRTEDDRLVHLSLLRSIAASAASRSVAKFVPRR